MHNARGREIYTHIHTGRGGSTKHKGWEAEALHVRAREHVCVGGVFTRVCASEMGESLEALATLSALHGS